MSNEPKPTPPSDPSDRFPSRRRSSGAVTAVGVVNYILGALSLLCGGCFAFGGGMIAGFGGEAIGQNAEVDPEAAEMLEKVFQVGGGLIVGLGVAYLVFSVLLIVAGVGVMKRRSWGRTLTLVLGGIAAVLAVSAFFIGEWMGAVTNLAYAVLVFAILLDSENAAEFA